MLTLVTVTPQLDRAHQQDEGQERQEYRIGHDAKEERADKTAGDQSDCQEGDEPPVATEDSKTAVAAVSRKACQHGRKADGERRAASQLDVATEQNNERRNQ